jgi:membrane protein implicated in regulation of membrane protease activity
MSFWAWIVAGIIVSLLELVIPSFTALWFGIGMVMVGGIVYAYPEIDTAYQVLLLSLFSASLTVVWYRYLKKEPIDNLALKDVQGLRGLIIKDQGQSNNGVIRFSTPLNGKDEWPFKSEDKIIVGEQAEVIDLQDDVLIISNIKL